MAAGVAPPNIGHGPDSVGSITPSVVYSAMREIRRRLETAIDSMKVVNSHSILDMHVDVQKVWPIAYMYITLALSSSVYLTEF